jgi:hypothetical protein
MFQGEHETENEVDGEERCVSQLYSMVAYPIGREGGLREQEHNKRKKCWLV